MNPLKPLLAAALVSAVIGLGISFGTYLTLQDTPELDERGVEVSVEYGRRLIRETSSLMGPDHEDPEMRFAGNNLDCSSCHLDSGTKPGTLSLLLASTRYPRFSGRDGVEGDLRDRMNGCMERSMNGRKLPRDSAEMRSMEAYVLSLGELYKAMGATQRMSDEPPQFEEPARAANPLAGKAVYEERCQVCHGDNGQGLQATLDIRDGYLFPPLWGTDTFNDGAGMHRVLTSANFIKARMPLGQPDLSNDQAFDVAAYINSTQRPHMENLEKDYPDLTKKAVDGPYGPYADDFSNEQHRIGPFEPIRDFYRTLESQ